MYTSWIASSLALLMLCLFAQGKRIYDMNYHLKSEACGEWELRRCVHFNGVCGAGYQMGYRTGNLCMLRETHFYCWKACDHLGNHTVYIPEDHAPDIHVKDRSNIKFDGSEKLHKFFNVKEAQELSCLRPGEEYQLSDGCTYRAGLWSSCEETLLRWSRNDTFVPSKSAANCNSQLKVMKECSVLDFIEKESPCSNVPVTTTTTPRPPPTPRPTPHVPKCKYRTKSVTNCQQNAKGHEVRHLVRVLNTRVSSRTGCAKTMKMTRTCYKDSGKARCFLSKWSDYSECDASGRQYKTRTVLPGSKCSVKKPLMRWRNCKIRSKKVL